MITLCSLESTVDEVLLASLSLFIAGENCKGGRYELRTMLSYAQVKSLACSKITIGITTVNIWVSADHGISFG